MLRCCSFEFRKICLRKISGNPHKIFVVFCCFTCRRVNFRILCFQHLSLKTCIIDAGFFQSILAGTDFFPAVCNLRGQFINAFFRKSKFCSRNADGKRSQYGNRMHFVDRCQCDHTDIRILQCHLVFVFAQTVKVKIITVFPDSFHLIRWKITPGFDSFNLCVCSTDFLFQWGFSV